MVGAGPAGPGRAGAGRAAALILALAAGLSLAALRWPALFDALVLDRDGLRAGQAWRLWSGHLLHVGATHATINLAAAAVLALIAQRLGRLASLLWMCAVAMPAIALGLLVLLPRLQWYAGLSGVLHAACTWLLLALPLRWALTGLALLACKLGWEMHAPRTVDAVAVVSEAHRLGVLCALLAAALCWLARRIAAERVRSRARRLP